MINFLMFMLTMLRMLTKFLICWIRLSLLLLQSTNLSTKNLQHRQMILFLGFFLCTLQITEDQICPFTANISWSYINPGREPKKMLGVVNQVLIKFTSLNRIFLETPYAKEHVTDWHKLDTVQNYKKYDTDIEPTTKELTSSTQGADSFSRSCSWVMCFKYSITKY